MLLKAGAVGAGLLAMSGFGAAGGVDQDNVPDGGVDEADGFGVEILTEHTPFPDDLSAAFGLTFAETDASDAIDTELRLNDESTMVIAEVTWEPGGTSGWHRHPGVVFVSMVEGEVEVVWEQDCVPRTYSAGEGFFDPGVVHNADNSVGGEPARAYAIFLGIPDGEPATEWVEAVDC